MEPLKNLPNFYVGQKVICIDNSGIYNTLVINKEYTIVSTDSVCKCKTVRIDTSSDINILTGCQIKSGDKVTCQVCRTTSIVDGYRYFLASRFVPLQQQSFPLMTYSKVIEKDLISQN